MSPLPKTYKESKMTMNEKKEIRERLMSQFSVTFNLFK